MVLTEVWVTPALKGPKLFVVMSIHSHQTETPSRAPASRRPMAARDGGFTIIEMMVAPFVLRLGVVGVASLLVLSARTATLAEVQSDATAIAVREIETIRSLDYSTVGVAAESKGFLPVVDGLPTVTESVDNLVAPIGETIIGDVVFGITRSVTWATVGEDEKAYKIVTVVVEWESSSGIESITVQTGVHDGMSGG